jgi:PAS domain S-box-containing protein
VTVFERRREDTERDERYQQLVELAPDGILVHDGDRIVLANASAVRLAGATSRAQLVGRFIDAFLDPPYLKAIATQLTDSISPADPAPPVRDTLHRIDGSNLDVMVRAVAFLDHGRPATHLVIRDITDLLIAEQNARQMEDRLHQAQRMESVGALAGGVAHEVNNMMQVVLGVGEFMLRTGQLPENCRTDVQEMVNAAERAAAVTRQLLAFSRRAVHRPAAVDLGAAVRDAEPVLRRLLGEGRRLVVLADASPQVWVDPGQLQQVVINLALNARDAMADGGTLTIATAEVDLPPGSVAADNSAIPAGHYASLAVRDTGAGIEAEVMKRIFEPFFTTKPSGEGTGLGLAAALGAMTQNSGFITVESAPGQGATFTVYLPVLEHAALPKTPAEPPRVAASAAYAGSTILVVDDEPSVRSIAARILERSGFRVFQAAGGTEALAVVSRNGPPQLVVTDLMMPDMGGTELARRLTELWPSLPIIFMSGYSAEELHRQGAIDPDRLLIQKPFPHDELLARVVGVLSQVALHPSGIE